jgi:hypothetical protein
MSATAMDDEELTDKELGEVRIRVRMLYPNAHSDGERLLATIVSRNHRIAELEARIERLVRLDQQIASDRSGQTFYYTRN